MIVRTPGRSRLFSLVTDSFVVGVEKVVDLLQFLHFLGSRIDAVLSVPVVQSGGSLFINFGSGKVDAGLFAVAVTLDLESTEVFKILFVSAIREVVHALPVFEAED